MKKYIIDTVNPADFTAGSKARCDIDDILITKGYEKRAIVVGENKKQVFTEVPKIAKQIKQIVEKMEPNSLVLVQYPWGTLSYLFAKILRKQALKKNIKTILVIHDLNSIRTGSIITKAYYELYVKEIKYIDSFDRIICHNTMMKNYLVQSGIDENKVISLEIFDYLLEKKEKLPEVECKKRYAVVNIAGNLSKEKATYLYQLTELEKLNYSVNLYGPQYEGSKNDSIHYCGTLPASELPLHLSEGFGLVWDGNSIDTCSGHFGNYLKFNNPHKLSLYIASGIPVIVWKYAAIAEFVEKYQVGYCIESIHEINDIMQEMTAEKYLVLQRNVSGIQKRVCGGYYTQRAIDKAEKSLGCD